MGSDFSHTLLSHIHICVHHFITLSPLLFSVFINDLASELNDCNAGINIGGEQLSLLMYADDIVLLSPDINKTQILLNTMTSWCQKWGMKINSKKSQVVHVRHHQKARCSNQVFCCDESLAYTDTYKYLGFYINEHLTPMKTVETLTLSASRSFGRVVTIFKKMKNLGIKTYETLYNSYVVPIMDYGSAVWGFKEQHEPQVLQNRVGRYFLGVNKFTPVPATSIEMDWLCPRFRRWLEILRYKNRLAKMDENRLPVKVYKWEKSLNHSGWVQDLHFILNYCNMPEFGDLATTCDLDVAEARLKRINRDKWWLECSNMSKLRTYIRIHDRSETQAIVKKNLSRKHRSQISKLKCGVLPIGIEVGRWTDVPEEMRKCRICDTGAIENEEHFLTTCPKLKEVRDTYSNKFNTSNLEEPSDNIEKIRCMLSKQNLKTFCCMLEELIEKRSTLMYKVVEQETTQV